MNKRNPLKIISGLGSARDGTTHFWHINLTAVANIPLTLFLIWFIICAAGNDRAEMVQLLSSPFIMVMLLLTIFSFAWHMLLGLQAVIEDYVMNEAIKIIAIILNIFFSVGVALMSIVSTLVLGLGG